MLPTSSWLRQFKKSRETAPLGQPEEVAPSEYQLSERGPANEEAQEQREAGKKGGRRRCRHLPAMRRALANLIGRALSPMAKSNVGAQSKCSGRAAGGSSLASSQANALKQTDRYQDKRRGQVANATRRGLASSEVSSASHPAKLGFVISL